MKIVHKGRLDSLLKKADFILCKSQIGCNTLLGFVCLRLREYAKVEVMKFPRYAGFIALLLLSGCSDTSTTKPGKPEPPPQVAPVVHPSPMPRPEVNLVLYPVKVSADGKTVGMKVENLSADFIEGPLQVLSAALRKYPKAQTFKVTWTMVVGSSWGNAKALYNRRTRNLRFDERGGMENFQEEGHVVFTRVIDDIIHKAAKDLWGRGGNSDAGFLSLDDYGCKKARIRHKSKGL